MISTINLPVKECNNLQSAVRQPEIVQQLVDSEIRKGFLIGPFDTPPFDMYRVSPLGVAQGKYSSKNRLIVDLSAPHGKSVHSSINDLINKNDCSLSYVTIDDAIQEIIKQGTGALMCKADISDAFKLIPIKPSQYHMFCVKWNDQYFYYRTLSFGCRSSPKIFDQFSSALCWILQNNYNVSFILHLLDDFLTVDKPTYDADRTMALISLVFNQLNVPLAAHKTMGPCTELEYLGIILDSNKLQARLPSEKVVRMLDILSSLENKKSCTKRELLQLLGHLNFAARVIPPGRSFVSYLLKIAHSVKQLSYHVHLNEECREDISMWKLFLQHWNGVSMFHDNQRTVAADMQLFTDASSTLGFGGYFLGQWFSSKWPTHLPVEEDVEVSMAFRELYPIVVAAMLWGQNWNRKRILFYCDNLGTVQIIRKGRSKSPPVMLLMRQLTWCAVRNNFCVYAEHLPGKANKIADALSRFEIKTFRELAPEAALKPCSPPPLSQVLWNFNKVQQSLC